MPKYSNLAGLKCDLPIYIFMGSTCRLLQSIYTAFSALESLVKGTLLLPFLYCNFPNLIRAYLNYSWINAYLD